MTPLAHIASSYLLAQSPRFLGVSLSPFETLMIVSAGNILDFDLIIPLVKRKFINHRQFWTHTPLGVIMLWFFYLLIFLNKFSFITHLLVFLSLFLHLFLDDTAHLFYKLGWQKSSPHSQINWKFPLVATKIFSKKNTTLSNPKDIFEVLEFYWESKVNLFLEVAFVIAALFVYFKFS